MLAQKRNTSLRLMAQHDHALASGQMALAWSPGRVESGPFPAPGSPRRRTLVLATALHDLGWQAADAAPRLLKDPGAVADFASYRRQEKWTFLSEGITSVARLDPLAGILVSLHHTSFLQGSGGAGVGAAEEERRGRLAGHPRCPGDGLQWARAALPWLQLFDNLSLFACLTPPGTDAGHWPPWLVRPGLCTVPGSGIELELAWQDEDRLAVAPYPFAAEIELELPYRELAGQGYFESQRELRRAWKAAPLRFWRLRLVEGRGA